MAASPNLYAIIMATLICTTYAQPALGGLIPRTNIQESKIQISTKHQIGQSTKINITHIWNLEFEIYLVFGF
jgi:hypothetical protein